MCVRCAYQGVRNVTFPENFADVPTKWPRTYLEFNPFQPSIAFHRETRYLICSSKKKWPVFKSNATLRWDGLNWKNKTEKQINSLNQLKQIRNSLEKVSTNFQFCLWILYTFFDIRRFFNNFKCWYLLIDLTSFNVMFLDNFRQE